MRENKQYQSRNDRPLQHGFRKEGPRAKIACTHTQKAETPWEQTMAQPYLTMPSEMSILQKRRRQRSTKTRPSKTNEDCTGNHRKHNSRGGKSALSQCSSIGLENQLRWSRLQHTPSDTALDTIFTSNTTLRSHADRTHQGEALTRCQSAERVVRKMSVRFGRHVTQQNIVTQIMPPRWRSSTARLRQATATMVLFYSRLKRRVLLTIPSFGRAHEQQSIKHHT